MRQDRGRKRGVEGESYCQESKKGSCEGEAKDSERGTEGREGTGKSDWRRDSRMLQERRWEAMKGEEEEVSTEGSEWGTVERHTIEQTTKKEQREGEARRSAGEIAVVRIYCLKINWVQPTLRENPLKSACVRLYSSPQSLCIVQTWERDFSDKTPALRKQ